MFQASGVNAAGWSLLAGLAGLFVVQVLVLPVVGAVLATSVLP